MCVRVCVCVLIHQTPAICVLKKEASGQLNVQAMLPNCIRCHVIPGARACPFGKYICSIYSDRIK